MIPWQIKRAVMRHRPFIWLWRLFATRLMRFYRYADGSRPTWRADWQYSKGLAEYMDECTDGYKSPHDAIDEDRQYWEG